MPAGIGETSNAVPALGNVPRRPGAGTGARAYEARDRRPHPSLLSPFLEREREESGGR